MRKNFSGIFCLAIAIFVSMSLQAQSRMSVPEKVAIVHDKFVSSFDFDKSKMADIDEIFTDFYTSQDKIRENIQGPSMSSGFTQGFVRQDYQSVRKQTETLISERDNRLKQQLSNEQFKKWKEEIEPNLRLSQMRRN